MNFCSKINLFARFTCSKLIKAQKFLAILSRYKKNEKIETAVHLNFLCEAYTGTDLKFS